MNKIQFISDYIKEYNKTILSADFQKDKIAKICNILIKLNKNNTIHVFGNGGSASIASHFSMDLTNNSKVKCLNYNDPAIITCYSND